MTDQALTKTIANIITNNLITLGSKTSKPLEDIITKTEIVELAKLFNDSKINNQGLAKAIEILSKNKDQNLNQIVEENKLLQVTDVTALAAVVQNVITQNVLQVEQYQSGKVNIIGFLVGQCMKTSNGSGNPKIFNELLTAKLNQN
jgi:aspartyl-tRNA(Asn)/glutamyl-tRNA(Gln) amidotransferase subunit B